MERSDLSAAFYLGAGRSELYVSTIHFHLPSPAFPDLDKFAGIAYGCASLFPLDGEIVDAIQIAKFAGTRHFHFGHFPPDRSVWTEKRRPRIADRFPILRNRRLGEARRRPPHKRQPLRRHRFAPPRRTTIHRAPGFQPQTRACVRSYPRPSLSHGVGVRFLESTVRGNTAVRAESNHAKVHLSP